MLALKLLRNCNLDEDAQNAVLAALQQAHTSELEDLLLKTTYLVNKMISDPGMKV